MADREQKTALREMIAPAIEKRIYVIRGRQVMLDEDLADLYGVETKRLVERVLDEELLIGIERQVPDEEAEREVAPAPELAAA